MRQAWLRKVENLAIIPCTEGVTALFRSTLNILNLRRKVSEWKSGNGVQTAQVKELTEDEWTALRANIPAPEADAGASDGGQAVNRAVVRRTALQTIVELLPTLTPGELHNVLFKTALLIRPAVECRETALLDCKERMQKILRERPVAEWGDALSSFVQAAILDAEDRVVGFRSPDPCRSGLMLLFTHPPPDWGYKATRRHALDPPVRVVDVRKVSFHSLGIDEPLHFPAKPPIYAGRAFTVMVQLQDSIGDWSPTMAVLWNNFAENPVWKSSVNVDFALWSSSHDRWCYRAASASIYSYQATQPMLSSSPKATKYLESYYDSKEYDQDLERQKAAKTEHRAPSGYQFCIEDVDAEVLHELERRKRRRLELD